jgi:hypothetical protein
MVKNGAGARMGSFGGAGDTSRSGSAGLLAQDRRSTAAAAGCGDEAGKCLRLPGDMERRRRAGQGHDPDGSVSGAAEEFAANQENFPDTRVLRIVETFNYARLNNLGANLSDLRIFIVFE